MTLAKPCTPKNDRRGSLRMETVFSVRVESNAHGFSNCIARNISRGGIMLEARQLIPLMSEIEIHFTPPDSSGGITARGLVKNHYYLQYGDAETPERLYGMGVRFTGFSEDGLERLSSSLTPFGPLPATVH